MDDTKRIISKSILEDIADAIRGKEGSNNAIAVNTFATRIAAIQTGIEPAGTANYTANGTYDIGAYKYVTINVNQSLTLPTLRPPSNVSRTAGSATFEVRNPNTNGSFPTRALIYNANTLVYTYNRSFTANLSVSIDILSNLPADDYMLYAAFGSDYFNTSAKSGYIEFSIYAIDNVLSNITNSNTATKNINDIVYNATLVANSGYYLPVHIVLVDMDTNTALVEGLDYFYDMYTGSLTLKMSSSISIQAAATTTPQLKEVYFEYDASTNTVVFDDVTYAETYYLYVDDVLVTTITPN